MRFSRSPTQAGLRPCCERQRLSKTAELYLFHPSQVVEHRYSGSARTRLPVRPRRRKRLETCRITPCYVGRTTSSFERMPLHGLEVFGTLEKGMRMTAYRFLMTTGASAALTVAVGC